MFQDIWRDPLPLRRGHLAAWRFFSDACNKQMQCRGCVFLELFGLQHKPTHTLLVQTHSSIPKNATNPNTLSPPRSKHCAPAKQQHLTIALPLIILASVLIDSGPAPPTGRRSNYINKQNGSYNIYVVAEYSLFRCQRACLACSDSMWTAGGDVVSWNEERSRPRSCSQVTNNPRKTICICQSSIQNVLTWIYKYPIIVILLQFNPKESFVLYIVKSSLWFILNIIPPHY